MRLTAPRRLAAVAVVLGASFVAVAAPAVGAPIDDKRAQAAALEAEISANAEQLAALNEQVMAAQADLDAAAAQIADAEAAIAAARAETQRLEKLVRERAASVYRSSGTGSDAGVFDLDPSATGARQKYADAASAHDDELIDQLAAAREDLAVRRQEAQTAREAAQRKRDELLTVQASFAAAQADRERLLSGLNGEIATMVAAQEAAKHAADVYNGFDPSSLPPPSGKAGAAVAYAEAQIGKPYEYGASGPNSFDCSGLTLAAWAQAGVALPHNSESQYNMFPHVPMNQLAPGDIVWRPDHVGIYVGNGVAIHATHPGDVVRYISVTYFQGASRPG